MLQAAELLIRAIRHEGSGRALAKRLGKPEQRISNWKNGIEQIPDESLAELATIVGDDPIDTLARERGGAWKRIAATMRNKISSGFEALRLHANPRRASCSAG